MNVLKPNPPATPRLPLPHQAGPVGPIHRSHRAWHLQSQSWQGLGAQSLLGDFWVNRLSSYTYHIYCIYPSIHLSICPSIDLSIYPFVHLSIYPFIHLSICPFVHLSIFHLPIYPFINRSIFQSIYLSIYISIYLFVYPSICLFIDLT